MRTADHETDPQQARKYPPFWERAVPWIVFLIALTVVLLIVTALLVIFGIFPDSL